MGVQTKQNTFQVQFDDGKKSNFLVGTDLIEILEYNSPPDKSSIVLALVNKRTTDLQHKPNKDCTLSWLSIDSIEANRSYQQTLCLILIRAVQELYPEKRLLIDHSLGKGLYCEFRGNNRLNKRMVNCIKKKMEQLIQEDHPIEPMRMPVEKALLKIGKQGEKPIWFLGTKEQNYLILYRCGVTIDYLGYPLFPSTGIIQGFDLKYWSPGMILIPPENSVLNQIPEFISQKKLFTVFHEYGQWEKIIGIEKASDINEAIASHTIEDLIKIAEGLHEKKIAFIADRLTHKRKDFRLALIAGPSSSGKTTFVKRLAIQLRVNGFHPLSISLDDYFLNRDQTPKDEEGNYDFESINAIDIIRFNMDMNELMEGKEVQLPRFDFEHGQSFPGPVVKIENNQPILVEGLHCMNDTLTTEIAPQTKMKIYVSALTQLNITDHLRVPTSDVRLLRRLIRDYQYRGYSPSFTLEQWRRVRKGEEDYIFPFQEQADIIFNTALFYELSILRVYSKPLLHKIVEDDPLFPEAQRILQLLLSFMPISPKQVPLNSILREFIGGSSFIY